MTSASDLSVAEGVTITATRRVESTPAALTAAFRQAGVDGPVNIVVESTAMAWFAAAVAVVRAGIDATLFRVSGPKAAALRAFYRQHTKTDRIDSRVLARMPLVDDALKAFGLPGPGEQALKRLVTLRHKLVPDTTRVADRVRYTLHWAAPGLLGGRELVTAGFVDFDELAIEFEIATAQHASLTAQMTRLEHASPCCTSGSTPTTCC